MADQTSVTTSIPVSEPPKKRKRNPNADSRPRRPRQKPVECPICLTARSPNLILTLPACNCTWCVACIREVFTISLQSPNGVSNFPAQCCGRVIDHTLLEEHLPSQLRKACRSKAEELSNEDPLYCANPTCSAYILEERIKDGFGSCGSCKRKTCTKPGCKRLREDHLGVYVICPGFFEDKSLEVLAEKNGWKRCPKCFALTERIRGCDGIRCICRTEWCYKCGKADKAKHPCVCHAKRPAQTLAPAALPSGERAGREVIVLDDDELRPTGHKDSGMSDIRPFIEHPGIGMFTTESELTAELDRLDGLRAQAAYNGEMLVEPTFSQHRIESDHIEDLDALLAPGTKDQNTPGRRSWAENSILLNRDTRSSIRDVRAESASLTFEDLFRTSSMYEQTSSEAASDRHMEFQSESDSVETEYQSKVVPQDMKQTTQTVVPSIEDIIVPRDEDHEVQNLLQPRHCHTPAPELLDKKASPVFHQDAEGTDPSQSDAQTVRSTSANLRGNTEDQSTDTVINTIENGEDWFMDYIEEELGLRD